MEDSFTYRLHYTDKFKIAESNPLIKGLLVAKFAIIWLFLVLVALPLTMLFIATAITVPVDALMSLIGHGDGSFAIVKIVSFLIS